MEFVGIDKFSILDYDEKVSIVLFSPACNFRCPFCHNGESVLSSTTYLDFNEILEYLKTRKRVIDAVVITGGEPTLMSDLKEKITKIKELGFLIKLDSNGTNPDVIEDLIKANLLDYIAMDIKNSYEKYPLTTANPNVNMENIKKSISIIMNSGVEYEFRTTIVKEYHDEESIKGVGDLIKGAKKAFLQKFIDREGVIKKGLHEIPFEEANHFREILANYVDFAELRGY